MTAGVICSYLLLAQKVKRIQTGTIKQNVIIEVAKAETQTKTEAYGIPLQIYIDKIGVGATILAVGINNDGATDVPSEKNMVSWYKYGAKPGETGSAVIAGHVTWTYGAAVFNRLQELQNGDEIRIAESSGPELKFKVTGSKIYDRDAFPIQEIYWQKDKPRLNLITCNGQYDTTTKDYTKRLVIFTELEDGN